jgi:hypothetical protein
MQRFAHGSDELAVFAQLQSPIDIVGMTLKSKRPAIPLLN